MEVVQLDLYASWQDLNDAYSNITEGIYQQEIGSDKLSKEGVVNLPEVSIYQNIIIDNKGVEEVLFEISSFAKFEGKIEFKEKGKLKIKSSSSIFLKNIALTNIDQLEVISAENIWCSGIIGNILKLEARDLKLQNHFIATEVFINAVNIDNDGHIKLKEYGLFKGKEVKNDGYIICEDTKLCSSDKGICGTNNEMGDRCDIEIIGEEGIYNTGDIAGRNIKLESSGEVDFTYNLYDANRIALRAWDSLTIKGEYIGIAQSIKAIDSIEISSISDFKINKKAQTIVSIESKEFKVSANNLENYGYINANIQNYTIKSNFKNTRYHENLYMGQILSESIDINAGGIVDNSGIITTKSKGSLLGKFGVINSGAISCEVGYIKQSKVEFMDNTNWKDSIDLGYYLASNLQESLDLLCEINIKSDNGEIKSPGVINSKTLEIKGQKKVELGNAQIDHIVKINKKPGAYIHTTDKVEINGGKIELHNKYHAGMYVGKELEIKADNEVDISSPIVVGNKFTIFAKNIVNKNNIQAYELVIQDSERFKNEGEVLSNIEINSSLEIVNHGKISVANIAKLHGGNSVINDGAISCKDGVNFRMWNYGDLHVINIGYIPEIPDSIKLLCNIKIVAKNGDIISKGAIVGREVTIESNGVVELGKLTKAEEISGHPKAGSVYLYSHEDTVIKARSIFLGDCYLHKGIYSGGNLKILSSSHIDIRSNIKVMDLLNMEGEEIVNRGDINSKKLNVDSGRRFINEGHLTGDINLISKGKFENKGKISIDLEGKIEADKGIINNGAIACSSGRNIGDYVERFGRDYEEQLHINYYIYSPADSEIHCATELKSLHGNIEIKDALAAKAIKIQSGKSVILGVKELPKNFKAAGMYLWGHTINIEGNKVLIGKSYEAAIESKTEFIISSSGDVRILGQIKSHSVNINGNNLENLGAVIASNYQVEVKELAVEKGKLEIADKITIRGKKILNLGDINANYYTASAVRLYINQGIIKVSNFYIKSDGEAENKGKINLNKGGKLEIEVKENFNNEGNLLSEEVRWCEKEQVGLCGATNEIGYSGEIRIISKEGEVINKGIIGAEKIDIEAKKKIELAGDKKEKGYSVFAWKNLKLNGGEILINNQVKSVHNVSVYSREKITNIELLQSNNEVVLNSEKVIEIYGKKSKISSGGKTTKVRAAKVIFGNIDYNSDIELSGAIEVNAGEIYNSKNTKVSINGIGYINVDSIINEGELIVIQDIAINAKGDFNNQGKFINEVLLNLKLGGLKLGRESSFGKEIINIKAKSGDLRGTISAREFNFRLEQSSLNFIDNLNVIGEAKLLLDSGQNIYIRDGYKVIFSKTEIRTEEDNKIGALICNGCDLEFGHNTTIKADKIKLDPIIYGRENKLTFEKEVLCKAKARRFLGIKVSPKKTYTDLDIYEQPQYSERGGNIRIKGDASLEFNHFRIFISKVEIDGILTLKEGSRVLEVATSGSKKFLDIKCLGNALTINDVKRITGFSDGDIIRYQSLKNNPFFTITQSTYQIYKYYSFLESSLNVGGIKGGLEYLILSSTNQLPVFTEQPNFDLVNAGEKALSMSDEFSNQLSKLLDNLKGGKDKNISNGAIINARGDIDIDISRNVVADPYTEINGRGRVEFKVQKDVVSGADIKGESIRFRTEGNLASIGDIESIEDIIIKAVNIAIAGQVKAGKDITIESLHNVAIMTMSRVMELKGTNYNGILSQITTETEILSETGDISVSGNNIGIAGAKLEGNNVKLDSKGKIHIIPVEIYNKVEYWTDRYYHNYQSKYLKKSSISSKDGGSIYINSGSGILLSGLDFKSDQKGQITSKEGIIVENPVEWESLTVIKKKKGFLGLSSSKTTEKSYDSCPVSTNFYAKGILGAKSEGDQSWEGVRIVAHGVRLEAGSAEREAAISIMPAYKERSYELYVKKTRFLKIDQKMVNFGYREISERKIKSKNVIPSIIQVEDEFLGYVNGRWEQLSTEIEGNKVFIKATDEVKLGVAPDMEYQYAYLSKQGIGVGFNANGDEFAVKAAVWGSKYEFSQTSYTHQAASITANFIQLEGDKIEDFGILYNAHEMHENARITFHGIAKDRISKEEYNEQFGVGLKIGIKSNLGSIYRGIKGIKDQDYSKPEGYINGYFTGLETYHNTLKLLSEKANHGVTGGVWFYGEYKKQQHNVEQSIAVPTVINVDDLYQSESEELKLLGTQITAYRSYIKTKYLDAKSAENTLDAKTTESGFDVEIPLSGSITGNIGKVISKANQYQRLQMNVDIQIKDDFRLDVQGHADMRGVFITAGNLEANFESLLLESAQDIIESNSLGINLGISGSKLGLEGFSGGIEKSKSERHVVERITAMIGEKSAHIVIANALRLNGAMIANAQKDEEGNYTDHGNIVLKVGELFIQHIHDYDDGYTLGAAFSTSKKYDNMIMKPTLGGHKKQGGSKSTIGGGSIKCEGSICEFDELEREINNIQYMETDYSIDPIKMYWSNIDTEWLKEGIAKKDGKIDISKALKDTVTTYKKEFKEAFSSILQYMKNILDEKEEVGKKEDIKYEEDQVDEDLEDNENIQEENENEDSVKISKKAEDEIDNQEDKSNEDEIQEEVNIEEESYDDYIEKITLGYQESLKKEMIEQTIKNANREIDNIKGLTSKQKNEIKESTKNIISNYINADADGKAKIVTNLTNDIKTLEAELKKQENKGIGDKLSSYIGKIIGLQESQAAAQLVILTNPVTRAALLEIGAILIASLGGTYAAKEVIDKQNEAASVFNNMEEDQFDLKWPINTDNSKELAQNQVIAIDKTTDFFANNAEIRRLLVDSKNLPIDLSNVEKGVIKIGEVEVKINLKDLAQLAGKTFLHLIKKNPYVVGAIVIYKVYDKNRESINGLINDAASGFKKIAEHQGKESDKVREIAGIKYKIVYTPEGEIFVPYFGNDAEIKDQTETNVNSASKPNNDAASKNKQTQQPTVSAAASGAPDPDDEDFDPNDYKKDFKNKLKNIEDEFKNKGWVKKDGAFHHPDAKNMKDIIPNKPNAYDTKLRQIYNELFQQTDKIPGGTMQILKEEFKGGMYYKGHLTKAENRLAQITKRLVDSNNPLSRADYETAQNVQRLLREAIKFTKGG